MPGLTLRGRRKQPTLRVLAWVLLFPIMLLWMLLRLLARYIDLDFQQRIPELLVFGPHPGCQAVELVRQRPHQAYWVVTDQRFACLTGDSATELAQTVREYRLGRFTYDGRLCRNFYFYERVRFPDGSGIDFLNRAQPSG